MPVDQRATESEYYSNFDQKALPFLTMNRWYNTAEDFKFKILLSNKI
jgi:hypothetical protein